MGYNRNKKSLALNLRSETGQNIFRKLVSVSDVVVDVPLIQIDVDVRDVDLAVRL